MKYLKIQNKGLLNTEFFHLMGVSSKSTDPTKIGEHGTGLKYATCFFLRNEIGFKIFVGENEVGVEVRDLVTTIPGIETVKVIFVGGERTSLSLQYGKQWKAWEAIREVYCNALDEDKGLVVEVTEELSSKPNHTTIFIEMTEVVQKVWNSWSDYFINEHPLFDNDKFSIYPALDDNTLRVYKQGILVQESPYYKGLFRYDFKDCSLNELRQYQGHTPRDIPNAILNSNREIIETFLHAYSFPDDHPSFTFELVNDWSWVNELSDSAKEILGSYMYLHPENVDSTLMDNQYRVPVHLFELFEKAGFVVERVVKAGQYYGGSGASRESNIRIVSNPELESKITSILEGTQLADKFRFHIGIPFKTIDIFDFTTYKEKGEDGSVYVFHNRLNQVSEIELECIVTIACRVFLGVPIYRQLKTFYLGEHFEASIDSDIEQEKNEEIDPF